MKLLRNPIGVSGGVDGGVEVRGGGVEALESVRVRAWISRAEVVVRVLCSSGKIPRSSIDPCAREAWISVAAGSEV